MKHGKRAKVAGLIAAMLLAFGLAVGCGGDDDDGGGGGGGQKTSNPEEYATAVCDAIGDKVADIEAVMGDEAEFEDPDQLKDAIDKAQPVIKDLAKDLDKIEPPSDIKDWHESMVKSMSAASDLLGRLKDVLDKPLDEVISEMEELQPELEDLQDPFALTDLPDEYADAFADAEACQDLDVFTE